MKCVIFSVVLFTIISISSAAKPTQNALIEKVQCVVDTMDKLTDEYHTQDAWQDIQEKMLKNINNLFLCLKSKGFALQRCVAKEVIGIGLSMNSFLGKLDSESPEAGKELRIRIADNCADSQ